MSPVQVPCPLSRSAATCRTVAPGISVITTAELSALWHETRPGQLLAFSEVSVKSGENPTITSGPGLGSRRKLLWIASPAALKRPEACSSRTNSRSLFGSPFSDFSWHFDSQILKPLQSDFLRVASISTANSDRHGRSREIYRVAIKLFLYASTHQPNRSSSVVL